MAPWSRKWGLSTIMLFIKMLNNTRMITLCSNDIILICLSSGHGVWPYIAVPYLELRVIYPVTCTHPRGKEYITHKRCSRYRIISISQSNFLSMGSTLTTPPFLDSVALIETGFYEFINLLFQKRTLLFWYIVMCWHQTAEMENSIQNILQVHTHEVSSVTTNWRMHDPMEVLA